MLSNQRPGSALGTPASSCDPAGVRPLGEIFRPENISSNFPELRELSEFSGISMEELAVFKPERLVVHEVLVRVIADLWVPDGDKYEDLGQNFRRMTSTIISKYLLPRMDEVETALRRFADADFGADAPGTGG